jgi:hypothetical protein
MIAAKFLSDLGVALRRFGQFVVAVNVDVEVANVRRENFGFPEIILQNSIVI